MDRAGSGERGWWTQRIERVPGPLTFWTRKPRLDRKAHVMYVTAALRARGYEPAVTDDGSIDLRNCPFHQLARQQPELTCQLNHALLRGVLAGHGADPDRAELLPRPGRCCVLVHPPR